MIQRKLIGYWRKLEFKYSQWKWQRLFLKNDRIFRNWLKSFQNSTAQVLVGAHLHQQGGVRNHLLSIQRYSRLAINLVPDENSLQRFGITPFYAHSKNFLQTPPPSSTFAVHTHVLPWLIDWAEIHTSRSVRWVHTHHALYVPESGRNGIEPWQSELNEAMLRGAKKSDICLCVSRSGQAMLKNLYDIDAHYLPNGVDVAKCDAISCEGFKKMYRIAPGFVLWVGRDDPIKNPHDFIRLARQLRSLNFVMIGGITKQTIENEYKLTVPTNLKLLPLMPHEHVLAAIAACKVLVVTSFREGLPTLVLEGMTMGKQIVIPNEPGCMEATNGNEYARIYTLTNIDQLATEVENAFKDNCPRHSARQRILEEFDWQVIAHKLDKIYCGKV